MPPPPRPTRPRIPLPILVPLLIVILVPLGAAWRKILSPEFAGGPNRCAMTYMNPAYFPVPGLNASSNEGNYAVWLYRERGAVGLTPDAAMASVGSGGGSGCGTQVWKTGRSIPGLFVPGNAGSYRQVRSVASETARRVDARRTSHQTSSPSVRPRGYARVGTRKRARRDRLVRAGFQRRAQRVSRRVAPPPNRLYVTRAGEDTGDVPTGDAGGHRGALHGGRGGTRRAARARKGRGLWVAVERHAHNAGDAACRLARGDGAVRGSRPSRHQRRVDR